MKLASTTRAMGVADRTFSFMNGPPREFQFDACVNRRWANGDRPTGPSRLSTAVETHGRCPCLDQTPLSISRQDSRRSPDEIQELACHSRLVEPHRCLHQRAINQLTEPF